MIVQTIIALGFLVATLLVAVFFAYIYTLKRQQYILFWVAGWALYGLHYLCPGLGPWIGNSSTVAPLNHLLFALAGVAFFLGTQLYTRLKLSIIPAISVSVTFVAWAAANAFFNFPISLIIPASVVYVFIGYLFWRESQRFETLADRLLGVAFALWGIVFLSLHFLKLTPESVGQVIRPITGIPTVFVSMLMVMALYEEEKRRVERNMLALSNLNLATSSFVGGEIQRMLSQALDRVLGVVRFRPALCSFIMAIPTVPLPSSPLGFNDEFCRVAQEQGLDDYLVGLVSRLGGLLGFRDLRDDKLDRARKRRTHSALP